MNRKFYIALSIMMLLVAATSAALARVGDEKGKHFGAAFTKAETVKLEEVTKEADKYSGKTVQIKGTIKDVCQMEGCWLVLTDGKREMRIKMKDHAFTVPKDSSKKKVIVEGVVEKQTISEEMARHYAEEAKDKSVDPASIKGPQVVITMNATGVRIDD